jgi:peptidyl-prolyl cis-trans isomerase C
MSPNRRRAALFLCAAALVVGCGKKGQKPVAEFGGRKIAPGELLIEYNAITPPSRPMFDTLEQKKAFLDVLVAKEILVDEATARKLDTRPEVTAPLKTYEDQQLFKALFDEKSKKVVTFDAAELEEFYRTSKAQVRVRDMWLNKDRALAETVLKALRAGGDFDALARKHSMNEYAKNGGDMGWTERSSIKLALFDEALSTMKVGDVSDILDTPAGYHIIQLAEEKPADMTDFEAQKISVRMELRQKKENQAWQTFVGAERDQAKLAPVVENIRMVQERARQVPLGDLPKFGEAELALPLVNYEGGAWTVADLMQYMENAGNFRPSLADSVFDFPTWMSNRAMSHVLLRRARADGIDKSPIVVALVARKKEEFMLDELHKELVKDVTVTEEEKREFYQTRQESLLAPPGASVRLVLTQTPARADSAYAALKAGTPFEQVVSRFSEDPETKPKGGLIDTLVQGMIGKPEFEVALFALEPGQYTNPYPLHASATIIMEMVRKWQGRSLTYEEVADQIAATLRTRKEASVFDEWLDAKKKSLNLKVHDDALNAIVAEEGGASAEGG